MFGGTHVVEKWLFAWPFFDGFRNPAPLLAALQGWFLKEGNLTKQVLVKAIQQWSSSLPLGDKKLRVTGKKVDLIEQLPKALQGD